MKKQPLALEYYNKKEFSELFEEFTKNNTLNRQERITTLNLMPKNLKGKKIIDIGCGTGFYTNHYIRAGAIVHALDYSEEMIAITKRKTKNKAEKYIIHDIKNQ